MDSRLAKPSVLDSRTALAGVAQHAVLDAEGPPVEVRGADVVGAGEQGGGALGDGLEVAGGQFQRADQAAAGLPDAEGGHVAVGDVAQDVVLR